MFELRLELDEDGGLTFRRLPAVYAETLLLVPHVLEDEDEKGRARLFPDVYLDHAENQDEWERYGKPELYALFASQGEIVRKDLAAMQAEREGFGYRLAIPGPHRTAWMAALNAARLMLGEVHSITAEDMARPYDFEDWDPEDPDERELARFRIDLMGEIEELLVRAGEDPGEL